MADNRHENYETLNLLGYGLAKFDKEFVSLWGFQTKSAFYEYLVAVGVAETTGVIKNRQDLFDPFFDNDRRGWWQRCEKNIQKKVFIDSLFGDLDAKEYAEILKKRLLDDGYEFQLKVDKTSHTNMRPKGKTEFSESPLIESESLCDSLEKKSLRVYLRGNALRTAAGYYIDSKLFCLLKGSIVRKATTHSLGRSTRSLRNKLVQKGTLQKYDTASFILTQNYTCGSSSQAASLVSGSEKSGPECFGYDSDNRGISSKRIKSLYLSIKHYLDENNQLSIHDVPKLLEDMDTWELHKISNNDELLFSILSYYYSEVFDFSQYPNIKKYTNECNVVDESSKYDKNICLDNGFVADDLIEQEAIPQRIAFKMDSVLENEEFCHANLESVNKSEFDDSVLVESKSLRELLDKYVHFALKPMDAYIVSNCFSLRGNSVVSAGQFSAELGLKKGKVERVLDYSLIRLCERVKGTAINKIGDIISDIIASSGGIISRDKLTQTIDLCQSWENPTQQSVFGLLLQILGYADNRTHGNQDGVLEIEHFKCSLCRCPGEIIGRLLTQRDHADVDELLKKISKTCSEGKCHISTKHKMNFSVDFIKKYISTNHYFLGKYTYYGSSICYLKDRSEESLPVKHPVISKTLPFVDQSTALVAKAEECSNRYIDSRHFSQFQQNVLAVLEKAFPKGMLINSAIDKRKFNRVSTEMNIGSINDVLLEDTIEKIAINFGDGRYMAPGSLDISRELLVKLFDFVHNSLYSDGNGLVHFERLYEKFRRELLHTNIYDSQILGNVIRYYMGDDLKYTRTAVTIHGKVNNNDNIEEQVFNVLINSAKPMTVDEIAEQLPNLNHNKIVKVLKNNNEVIRADRNSYWHIDSIHITDEQKEVIKKVVSQEIEGGFIHARRLMDILNSQCHEFIEQNGIYNYLTVYDTCKFYFEGIFEFRGQFVGELGQEMSGVAAVEEFIKNEQRFKLSELFEYIEQNNLPRQYSIFIKILYRSHFRVNSDDCIPANSFNIQLEDLVKIEDILSGYMPDGYVSVGNIKNYLLPNVHYDWNGFLLESIIRHFSKKMTVIDFYQGTNKAMGIIVKNDCGIKSHTELLIDVLRRRDNVRPFSSEEDAERYLIKMGYLNKRNFKDMKQIYNTVKNK